MYDKRHSIAVRGQMSSMYGFLGTYKYKSGLGHNMSVQGDGVCVCRLLWADTTLLLFAACSSVFYPHHFTRDRRMYDEQIFGLCVVVLRPCRTTAVRDDFKPVRVSFVAYIAWDVVLWSARGFCINPATFQDLFAALSSPFAPACNDYAKNTDALLPWTCRFGRTEGFVPDISLICVQGVAAVLELGCFSVAFRVSL